MMLKLFGMIAVALASIFATVPTVWAQQPAPVADADQMNTPEAVDALVARMSDDEVRALLLDYLKLNAADTTEAEAVTPIDRFEQLWQAFLSPAQSAISKLPDMAGAQVAALSTFAERYGGSSGILRLFGIIVLVLAIGFVVERAARPFILRLKEPAAQETEKSLKEAVGYLFRRFMGEFLGLMIFYLSVWTLGRALLTAEELMFAGPFVTYLVWIPRLAAAVSRFLFAPNRPQVRLISLDDAGARFLHGALVGLFFLAGFNIFYVGFTLRNVGPTGIGFWLDSLVYVYIVLIAWFGRDSLRRMMLGTDRTRSWIEQRAADLYPRYVMLVAIGMWILVMTLQGLQRVSQILQGAHYVTLFWLLALPVIDAAIRGLVRHLLPTMQGEGRIAEEAFRSTERSYVNIGRVLAAGVILFLIADAWGLDFAAVIEDRPGLGDNFFAFLLTLVVGYVAYEGVSLWLNRKLAAEKTALASVSSEDDNEMGGAGNSRLSTVLPLAILIARTSIVVMFGLLALGNLGIDIMPLLAGAGVLGLAIGFGAQKLVADVVSGAFFLIDDAFRTGEYVDVGGTMGTVEKISIRSLQLRHHRGAVHTVPYGEIPKLTNYSRDWVIMKLKFTVPFETDPIQVKRIFKKIGQEMMEIPEFADDFLEPFKSQGVFEFDDVGMVVRGKFMAKPGRQFTLRKEIYNRVRKEFKENGIEFARREVKVAIPDKDMTAAEKDSVAQVAAAAGDAEPAPGKP